MKYVVSTIRPWNIEIFKKTISKYPGKWYLISNPKELTLKTLNEIKPKYIFFPHWSEIVSKDILEKYECIGFHEADLPYGRGGSPVQNLILLGKNKSKISAFHMTDELDSGEIYMKTNISLKGTAQEIFERNAKIVAKMIKRIISKKPERKSQKGKVIFFKRRTPSQSDISKNIFESTNEFYNFIRALDANTYPKAFLKSGNNRIEFFNPIKKGRKIICNIQITK
jgi:methionyl-tRNA formyltransferase